MKKPRQFTQYLIIGIVLLVSVSGNKVILANRIQGTRRVWEVKAIWSGADVPAISDCLTTSTGRTVVRKVACFDSKINHASFSFLIKEYYRLTNSNSSPLLTIADKTNKSYSARRGSHPNISAFNAVLTENKVPVFQKNNILTPISETNEQVTLAIKETLRYLERLPGH